MSHPVDIQLLGSVQVSAGETVLPRQGVRRERLLAALALAAPQVVSIDRLIDVVWPTDPPLTARRQVQDLTSRLRRDLATMGCLDPVRTVGAGYSLTIPASSIDVSRFRSGVAAGRALRATDPQQAARLFRSALAQWHGDALAGLDCPALEADRIGLAELRLGAWEQLVELDLATGQAGELLSELAALVESNPARERLTGLYMHALYRSGRAADALSAFHRLRQLLADELGINPGPELQQMHEWIVRDDPRLAGPPGEGRARPAGGGPRQLPHDIADFTGRASDVLRLSDILSAAARQDLSQGTVPVAVVSGPGGIGKTALAVHVAHRMAGSFPDGQVFVDVRGTSAAPLSAGEILARYLHALQVPSHDVPVDQDHRAAEFRSQVHGRRLLFVLDDAGQAAQVRDSLPASGGCAVVVTSRDHLRSLPGAQRLQLDPLTGDDARDLFGRVAGRHWAGEEPGAVTAMIGLCAGLPLAVRISAAQLAAQPAESAAALAARLSDEQLRLDGMSLDDLSVRSSFRVGYDSLLSSRQGWATAAALRRVCLADGPHFGLGAATALLGGSTAQAELTLARLVEASLLQGPASGRYQLHDLLRLFARERAEAQDPAATRAGALHALLRWHLHSASNAARAIGPARRHAETSTIPAAGEPASFAGPDPALRWLDAELPNLVCSVHQAASAGQHEIAWKLATTLWDVFTLRGSWTDWISTHETALRSTRLLGDRFAEAWICNNLSTALTRTGRIREAVDCLGQALEAVREIGDTRSESGILGNLGNAHQELGQLQEALDLYQQALSIGLATGNQYRQCVMHLNIADAQRLLGQHDNAIGSYREALDLPVGDDHLTGVALSGLGDISISRGRAETAVGYYRQALEVHRRIGNRPGELQTLDGLAVALDAAGQQPGAQRCRFEASVLRGELGQGRPAPGT